jgi:hypothetical protein
MKEEEETNYSNDYGSDGGDDDSNEFISNLASRYSVKEMRMVSSGRTQYIFRKRNNTLNA